MQSIEKQIEKSIKSKPKGSLVLPCDYLTIGSSEAIRKALNRLEEKKVIIRVAHGIYVRPKISKLIGLLTPSAEEVAEAIAKRDRIRTVPTGSYALNALGLSTQVPMNIVLLTDGSPREIKVGKRTIKFKKRVYCSGSWTRTSDLRVMSPTSYQLLHPAMCLKG
jgi:predicted transcriptional regulator of viral defense system